MVIFEAFFIFFTCIIVFAHVFRQRIKNLLQEYVPRSLLRQLSDNQNIDEDVRQITEAGDHLDLPLTTPSSSQRSGGSEFEVFLSFRGEDTRKGFTGHLYDTLQDRGVSTFIDSEKLEKGEEIDKLLEYMKKSQICVLIISKRYAESKWCLKEVTKSVECNMKIIPIFFGVEPSNVRNQSGPFRSAFKHHESNKKLKQEEVRKWREALTKVGKISGFNLKDMNGDEAKLKHVVIERVLSIVNKKPLVVAKHPIGIETHVEEVQKMLENRDKGVNMIGIHGMGGLGKTTIAKALYNELANEFDCKTCFLSNVRETDELPNGLVTLQKQVLQDILNDGNIYLNNVAHGASLIEKRVSEKKALLIIDDVDSVEQLNALAGGRDWFGLGSVIIITTRDEQVLLAHNVKEDKIYKPHELNKAQSLELFMLHAFNGEPPQQEEYVELSNEVVGAAGGLPLTLEVVGSLLSSKRNIQVWKDTLEKLKKIPPHRVQQRLMISYDSLDEMQKKIFLDISCFFIRRRIIDDNFYEYATYMWEGNEWFPHTAIDILVQRSLIKIHEKYGGLQFEMHDQIRDMGRAIVEEECSGMFQKKSRLRMVTQDSLDLLSRKVPMSIEAEGIQIIRNDHKKYCVSTIYFEENMPNLRYFAAEGVNFQGMFPGFPPNLKWLELVDCNFDSMPSDFNMEKLLILILHNCNFDLMPLDFNMEKLIILKLWETNIAQVFINQIRLKGKAFEKLKVLSIRFVETNFTLDFTNIPCLVKLQLAYCPKLIAIDESIGNLKNLTELCVDDNENLGNLPESIGKLSSLKKLLVNWCIRLSRLPDSICQLISLEELDLNGCRSLYCLPEHIGHMESLKKLNLWNTCIEVLPVSVCQLKLLEYLDVSSCEKFCSLPERVGDMEKLRELILDFSGIKSIPDSVEQLRNLCRLSLKGCNDLEALPNSITNLFERICDISKIDIDLVCSHSLLLGLSDRSLKALKYMHLKDATMEEIPDCVGRMENLDVLIIECEMLKEFFNGIGSLQLLQSLTLKCKNLKALLDNIGSLKQLQSLALECENLKALPDNIGLLQQLRSLTLKCENLKALPDNIGSLEKVKYLTLECKNLKALPDSIGSLEKLDGLTLECENLKALPDSIGSLEKLDRLTLKSENLKALCDSIGSLQQLRKLTLECENLKALPDNIRSLQQLHYLALKCENLEALLDIIKLLKQLWSLTLECENLKVFPDSIGSLEQLNELILKCEKLKALPDSIGSLQQLSKLTLECENLEALPDSIGLLKMMHSLKLKCTNLKALPNSIGEFENIQTLQIESPKLKALPDSIAFLTSGTLEHLSLRGSENLEAVTGFAHLSCLLSLNLVGCHSLQYLPPLPSSLLSLDAFGCTKLMTISDLSGLKALEKLSLGGCQLLEDVPGIEHISHNLQALELPGPCDFIGRPNLSHDFVINKVLEKKEATFKRLRRFEMSGSLTTKGSATGNERLHFILPRLPFIWLRRAWLTLRLDKVIPPIHAVIMADETILLEKIIEVIKDDQVELNLRDESFLNTVEGEEEHFYTMQVIVDVSHLQNVSVVLEQTRGWLYDMDL